MKLLLVRRSPREEYREPNQKSRLVQLHHQKSGMSNDVAGVKRVRYSESLLRFDRIRCI